MLFINHHNVIYIFWIINLLISNYSHYLLLWKLPVRNVITFRAVLLLQHISAQIILPKPYKIFYRKQLTMVDSLQGQQCT